MLNGVKNNHFLTSLHCLGYSRYIYTSGHDTIYRRDPACIVLTYLFIYFYKWHSVRYIKHKISSSKISNLVFVKMQICRYTETSSVIGEC